jgi:D-galactarolactone isomerase
MSECDRRQFLQRGSGFVLSAAGVMLADTIDAQSSVPNSAGTAPPKVVAPRDTCDCHHHIYDPTRFPPPVDSANPVVSNARLEEYALLQRRLHTTRSIVVTPAAYVTDNKVTLDAIARRGGAARGVAVIRPDITDAELKLLQSGGIRGIRFSLDASRAVVKPATTIDMIEPLSKRIVALGWHVQINQSAEGIAAAESLWNRLPCPIVFDHIGHIPGSAGTRHPAYTVMRRLIDKGRTWVKLSVTQDNAGDGPPTYSEVVRLGQAFVTAAPERLVWGSNWPHPTEPTKPDDAVLFDLMARWAPDAVIRRRILVDNAARLYGF